MVNKLINDGTATVDVLDTTSTWFGVTYPADRDGVVARIKKTSRRKVSTPKSYSKHKATLSYFDTPKYRNSIHMRRK